MWSRRAGPKRLLWPKAGQGLPKATNQVQREADQQGRQHRRLNPVLAAQRVAYQQARRELREEPETDYTESYASFFLF